MSEDFRFGLFCSLAATTGISFDYSSSGYLDVSVHRVILPKDDRQLRLPGCPIRKYLDQSLLAAPQVFSQLTASFIDSQCLGIHRMPFVA